MLISLILLCLQVTGQVQGKPPSAPPAPSGAVPLFEPMHEVVLFPQHRGIIASPLVFSTESPPKFACVRQIKEENRTEILLKEVATLESRTLLSTPQREIINLDWSPDNRYIAVISKVKEPNLQIVEVSSGHIWELGRIGTHWIRWGADSKSLLFWMPQGAPVTEPPQWRLTRLSAPWDSPQNSPLPHFYQNAYHSSEPSSGTLSPNAKTFAHWRLDKHTDGSGVLNLVLEEIGTRQKTTLEWRKYQDSGDFFPYYIEFDWSPDQQWLYIVYQRGEASRPFHYMLDRKTNKIQGLNTILLSHLDTGNRVLLPIRRWIQARGIQLLFLAKDAHTGEPFRASKERDSPPVWSLYNPQSQTMTSALGCPSRMGRVATSATGKYLLFQPSEMESLELYRLSLRYLIPLRKPSPLPQKH